MIDGIIIICHKIRKLNLVGVLSWRDKIYKIRVSIINVSFIIDNHHIRLKLAFIAIYPPHLFYLPPYILIYPFWKMGNKIIIKKSK